MKTRLSLVFFLLASSLIARAQSGAVIPQGGSGHADQASCVIVKRMGPADQVTSRLYSFGIRGKQFQYVEGKFPEGFPFHGRMTDHDVRNLQERGAKVMILEPGYTAEDLKQAREECRKMTDKTPNQAPQTVTLEITSTPIGADIEVDGKFIGNTPSSIGISAGEHKIKLTKNGYVPWERNLTASSGTVKVSPELEPVSPAK
jgi:hypothetical protein